MPPIGSFASPEVDEFVQKHNIPSSVAGVLVGVPSKENDSGFYVKFDYIGNKHYPIANEEEVAAWLKLTAKVLFGEE